MRASIHYVVASLNKQLYLSDVVGNHGWHFDLASGLISFSPEQSWHVQLLGTESESSNTWLWAWANTESNFCHPRRNDGRKQARK